MGFEIKNKQNSEKNRILVKINNGICFLSRAPLDGESHILLRRNAPPPPHNLPRELLGRFSKFKQYLIVLYIKFPNKVQHVMLRSVYLLGF